MITDINLIVPPYNVWSNMHFNRIFVNLDVQIREVGSRKWII